jgi:hypothetical protein
VLGLTELHALSQQQCQPGSLAWVEQTLSQQQQQRSATPLQGASSSAEQAAGGPVDVAALALLLTAAKVLFCGGALTAAARVLQLCEPAVLSVEASVKGAEVLEAGQREQHQQIRNELAYASLLRRLLREAPPGLAAAGRDAGFVPLFVCGDSHILPGMGGGAGCAARAAIPGMQLPTACSCLMHARSCVAHRPSEERATAAGATARHRLQGAPRAISRVRGCR